MTVERYPWERRPGEASKPYAAFLTFRDLPVSQRSVRATETIHGTTTCRNWAVKWDWLARAVAWDDECQRVADLDRLEALRVMHGSHARAAKALQDFALAALAHLDADDASPSDVARLLELGAKLERLTLTQSIEELQGKAPPIDADDPWGRITRELANASPS